MPNEYIEQASTDYISTATTTVAAQVLSTAQAKSFIRLTMDKAQMLKDIPPANVLLLDAPAQDISRISWSTYNSQMGLGETEEMAETEWAVPTYGKRTITPKAIELHVTPTQRMLWDNIEREGHLNTINEEIAQLFANDIEFAAIRGDTSESAGWTGATAALALDSTIDGFRVKFEDGNIVDAAGAHIDADVFQDMIEALDAERQIDMTGFKYYVSPQVWQAWVRYLQTRSTDLGDMALIQGGVPAYRGIPLVPVSQIPNAEDGTGAGSVSAADSYSYIFLCRPEQLFIGFNPRLKRHMAWRNSDGKVLNIHLYAAFDVQIDRPEWTALATNVTPHIA